MSRVNIEIDGLKLGLRVRSEDALQLVEALQSYWVAVEHKKPLIAAVEKCNEVFDQIIGAITVDAITRRMETEAAAPVAEVIELHAHRKQSCSAPHCCCDECWSKLNPPTHRT